MVIVLQHTDIVYIRISTPLFNCRSSGNTSFLCMHLYPTIRMYKTHLQSNRTVYTYVMLHVFFVVTCMLRVRLPTHIKFYVFRMCYISIIVFYCLCLGVYKTTWA